jgi:hypothetical protein
MNEEPAEDPALEAQIEAEVTRALEPYVPVYPLELMDEAKRLLRFSLRNDPATRQRLRLLRADPVVDDSGKVSVGAFRVNGASKRAAKGGGK